MAKEDKPAGGLSFPHATFAKLTPNAFLHAHLKHEGSIRPNGRQLDQFRDISINTSSLAYSNGSAVVRLGDTAVVCGVRGEILTASDIPLDPRPDTTDEQLVEELGLLVPNLELSTGCSPAHLPGNPPSTQAQSLSWRISSLLHTTNLININDLRIQYTEPAAGDDVDGPRTVTKAYWTLYIDILCISLDGNCFDAAWLAIVAALKDTKLPRASWDADREIVLCSSVPEDVARLRFDDIPITASFATFSTASPLKAPESAESWTLADPNTFEEEATSESVTITVRQNDIARVEKAGGQAVGPQQLEHCIRLARARRTTILHLLEQQI